MCTKKIIFKYECDRCGEKHTLDQNSIINKEHYVAPYSCYAGNYWTHDYYYFTCSCNRPIEVKKDHVESPYLLMKDHEKNVDERCIMNVS